MSEPLQSPEFKDQFRSLLKGMQAAGAFVESQNYNPEYDPGSAGAEYGGKPLRDIYDEDEAAGIKSLIPLLQLIPGVHIDENAKNMALDAPDHVAISAKSLSVDLAYASDQRLIDVDIEFGERPTVTFGKVVDSLGLSVALKFDGQANLSGITITKVKIMGDLPPRQHESMGSVDTESSGNIVSSHGSLKDFDKGHIDLVRLLANVTDPRDLDRQIDFKKIIPLSV
jgi:hypothetical protein